MTTPAPADLDPSELRDLALEVGREAAATAVRLGAEQLQVDTKSTATDLVTNADTAVEQLISSRLAEARPGDLFLGEETVADHGLPDVTDGTVVWVVDPIDGTTNYVYDYPGWGVSIAAELDGTVVAGAISCPSQGEEFDAAQGLGARRNGELLQLGPPPSIDRALVATGFGYDPERRRRQGQLVARLLPEVRDIRRMGAASADFCSLASQRVDAYFEEGLGAWDLAAGMLIAAEAGARCAGLDGGPALPEQPNLCCHPDLWDELAALIRRCASAT